MDYFGIFWNLQRFFDPVGLPVARALGSTSSNWGNDVYKRKLENISSALLASTGGEAPAFIGLAEVESLRVLTDIRTSTGWDELVIVDEVKPDHTLSGLDVSFMFNKRLFRNDSLSIHSLALDNRFSTRDLLIVWLKPSESNTKVFFCVAHWPSRLISEGRTLRFAYSVFLRRYIESALKYSKSDIVDVDGNVNLPDAEKLLSRWNVPGFLMGDFNDEPFDPSIRDALKSTRFISKVKKRSRMTGKSLEKANNYLGKDITVFNPCWNLSFPDSGGGGTYYRSEWRTYDQVLCTHGALSDNSAVGLVENSTFVYRNRNNLGTNDKPINMTTRSGLPKSFESNRLDGVSDHFPILFKVSFPH